MEGLQARLDSFKKSKRVKNPNRSSSTTTLKWPHPSAFDANPATLAEAGFFYDPSYDDPDNVTCFYCDKQLAGWEGGDDPYIIHWNKCASTCCWAIVQCGLKVDMDRSGRFTFPDENRLPDNKAMEKARLETFKVGKGWIHDKNKNHRANSKSMARAGFVYTPQESGDDLAACLYCNISLSGWDDDDDPLEEHRKRSTKSDLTCPFFGHSASQPKPPPRATNRSTKPSSKSQSKPPSRSTSRTKYQDILLPTKTFDGELEDDAPNSKTAPRDSTTKTPAKSRSRSTSGKSSAKTPASKSRSTSRASRSRLQGVTEEEEEDEEEQPAEAPPTVKKKTRSKSKSVPRPEITAQSDGEGEAPVAKTNRKPSHSRAKSKAPIEVESEEEESGKSSKLDPKALDLQNDVVTPDQPRKSARKSSKSRVVESDKEEVTVATAKQPSKAKRTASRSKSKAPPPANEESAKHEPVETGQPSTMKAKERIPAVQDLFNDDIFLEDHVPPPSSPPPTWQLAPTTELPRLIIPKRTMNAEVEVKDSSLPASTETPGDLALPPPAMENDKDGEKRKPGRPPKVKATTVSSQVKDANAGVTTTTKSSKPPSKQAAKIVEVSSDEEIEEVKPVVKARKSVKNGSAVPPSASASQEKENQQIEQSEPQDSVDVSMDSAQEPKHETGANVEMEMRTAPSTPSRPVQSALVQPLPEPLTPPSLQAVDNKNTAINSGMTMTSTTITAEPLFVPPLSRLPFVPLHTLNEAELDMTVEEWIRYQIEVEQDRFKRDGERELERFKKRAEEVRGVIEGL